MVKVTGGDKVRTNAIGAHCVEVRRRENHFASVFSKAARIQMGHLFRSSRR
jgi:hypothetical protein